jgi:hypothetical protein
LRYQTGDLSGALEDIDWLLEKMPEGLNLARTREMKRILEMRLKESEK